MIYRVNVSKSAYITEHCIRVMWSIPPDLYWFKEQNKVSALNKIWYTILRDFWFTFHDIG